MKASELIKQLQELITRNGDKKVFYVNNGEKMIENESRLIKTAFHGHTRFFIE